MDLYEIVDQVSALLQQRGRLTYRMLKRQFGLDDETLADLKDELIKAAQVARDENGEVLVWAGQDSLGSSVQSPTSGVQKNQKSKSKRKNQSPTPEPPLPVSYTPAHLAERIRATVITDGERKTITALFADLKGSTALIEDLDPEEAQRVIDPALQLMMDAVHQYEGFVAQPLGDGIFALFGAPLAHEDHPQRALYAALRMQESMRRYADALRQKGYPPLLMRVGLNTGEVVLRSIRKDDLHTDYVPVGHSTNLAARMEQMATPGSILITEDTKKLTEGFFECKALGAADIKGRTAPLAVYEVLGAGPLRTRLQVAARQGLTRFVGRHSEMEQLHHALDHAKAGHGQIVGVMGEPGLGKSRLFYEFKVLSLRGCLVLEAYSVSYGKATAYLPVIELLKSYFDIQAQDEERKRREKVNGKVLTLDPSLEDTLPYLFALLGVEEQPSPLAQMDPQIRRRRTFDALKKLFLRESLNQPLVLIFEDLHWIDAETQGFLDVLSESVASAKLLLLTNYRPEYRHEWGQKTYYTQLRLVPLGKEEAEELLTVLLGDDATLTVVKRLILEKTEGTPFFMEEVVQTLAEKGVLRGEPGHYHVEHAPTALHISPTVQGVLAARIDRLAPEEKALLQQVAVIGREFPLSLARQVVSLSEAELYRLLSSLQHKELLYEQPAFPDVEYLFKHALTQEVAYGSLPQERRKAIHEQTATAMEALYRVNVEEHYSELAHHYSRSGNTPKAVEYLHKAGQQAVQRCAYTEAISHVTQATELLETLPDTPERTQRAITVQTLLGLALHATRGQAAPEVERAYARARELGQQLGQTPQLFPTLYGLWGFYLVQGELSTTHELGEQLLNLARRDQDPALLLDAHRALGFTLYHLGEFAPAREHAEQAIALYDPRRQNVSAFIPGVTALSCAALALWHLGYPDQALKRNEEALTLAWERSHPFSLVYALGYAARFHQLRREAQAVRERAEAAFTLATEHGFALWPAAVTILQGWVLTEQGEGETGIAQMRRGLAARQASWTRLDQPYYLALLAEAYSKVSQVEEGLAVLAEALAAVTHNGERRWEAEVYRLKGELTLQLQGESPKSKIEEAETCFLQAINVARKQQAKSLELRATMSLARLWQGQGKRHEARDILSTIYNWFTEGFDTQDLKDAKALLDSLASGV